MSNNHVDIKTTLELLSYLAVVLGVPIGLYRMSRTAQKEQLDREYGTYNALDEKYLEYLALCFNYPYLDVFDISDQQPIVLDSDQQKQELIAFTMLFSILERAFLMYSDQSTQIKQRQWSGWRDYIMDFCSRENFRQAWKTCGDQFDKTFVDYVSKLLGPPDYG